MSSLTFSGRFGPFLPNIVCSVTDPMRRRARPICVWMCANLPSLRRARASLRSCRETPTRVSFCSALQRTIRISSCRRPTKRTHSNLNKSFCCGGGSAREQLKPIIGHSPRRSDRQYPMWLTRRFSQLALQTQPKLIRGPVLLLLSAIL